MIYSGELNMYEVKFHDPDQSIYNGRITVSDGTTSTSYTIDYSDDEGGELGETLELRDLRVGSKYTVTITADQVRRSSGTSYRYPDFTLFSYTFVAGEGISGKLSLNRLAFSLVNDKDESKSYLLEDFDLFDGTIVRDKYVNGSGELSDTGYWRTTDFLDLGENGGGKVYYLDRVRSTDTADGRLAFYDEQKNVIKTNVGGGNATVYNGSYVQAPENARYVRYSAYDVYQDEWTIRLGGFYAMELEEGAEIVKKAADEISLAANKPSQVYTIGEGKNIEAEAGRDALTMAVYRNTTSTYTYTFYKDEVGNEALGEPVQLRNGQAADIPAGAKAVTISCTVTVKGPLYVVDGAKKEWLESADRDSLKSVVEASVQDTKRNLIQDPSYKITVYQDGKDITDKISALDTSKLKLSYADEQSGGSAQTEFDFDCEAGSGYEILLTTRYQGRTLTLDRLSFEADRPKYIIADASDLYKLARYKNADFIVTNDLDLEDNSYLVHSNIRPFNGTIDFQNHKVNIRYTKGGYRLFRTLGSSAVLENLELNVTMDTMEEKQKLNSVQGLCYDNYGTIRNIIVNLNLGSGFYQKNSCAGICYNNRGTIENFALYYDGGSYNYVGSWFGGLALYNYGTIRNGMAYSPRWIQAITGEYKGNTTSSSTDYVGGVVAYNSSGGSLSNIYSLLNLGVERDKRVQYNTDKTQFGNQMTTNGVLVGYVGSGRVTNCFTVGDLYEMYWAENDSGSSSRFYTLYSRYTPVGNGQGNSAFASKFRNSYYFSTVGSYQEERAGALEKGGTLQRLMDSVFYNSTVNTAGQFQMSDVDSGFYPRVQMNETLLNRQQKLSYSKVTEIQDISYVGATVDDQQDAYADVTMIFTNARGYKVENLQIDGLFVTATGASDSSQTDLEYEQYAKDKFYYVKVRLWPNETYRDTYKVNAFGVSLGDVHATIGSVGREIGVSFYRGLTEENWLEKGIFNDKSGNYRLLEDIDMNTFGTHKADAAKVLYSGVTDGNSFQGKLDGGGYTIRNLELTDNKTFIPYMKSAEIYNLKFENVTIDNTKAANYAAIFGRAMQQTSFHDIYVDGVTLKEPYQYSGGLVADLNNSSVLDCAVKNVKATVTGATSVLRLGGVVGYHCYSTIENTYASGVDLEVSSAKANVTGIGGIAGDMTDSSTIMECYAQGRISTSSGEAGGIVGSTNGTLNRCWAKVDVSGSSVAGGIAGRVQSSSRVSQLLSVGNVSGQTGFTGRIAGTIVSEGTKFTDVYAYSGQKMNSEISEEAMDANGLMTSEQLRKEADYWYYLNLGYAFDYSLTGNSCLPRLYNDAQTELLPGQDAGIMQEKFIGLEAGSM